MSFLAPLFLLGVALIGGPIIAHLIRRATRERVAFSAMRFLDPSPPKLNKRSRIEHPWLLLLRCLVVAGLAFAFARPFLRVELPLPPDETPPQSVVVVLDESASMSRAGLWDSARQKIVSLAQSLAPKDQLVLLAASDATTELIDRDRWKSTPPSERPALVQSILASRQPGSGPARLDSAIENAITDWQEMTEAANGAAHNKLVVVSDMAGGTRLSGLAGLSWPKDAEVSLERVEPHNPGNAGLQWLGWAADTGSGAAARVRVTQSSDSAIPAFSLQLKDAATGNAIGAPQNVVVAPGGSQVVLVPVPDASVKNPLRIDLTGDKESFDNTLWAVHPAPREVMLSYYGDDDAKDVNHARFYLEKATAGWKDPQVHFQVGDVSTPTGAKAGHEVMVVDKPLDASKAAELHKRIEDGAFAIVLLTNSEMVDTASVLAGESGWKAAAPPNGDALLGQIDFQHPLFTLFADPRYSDFSHIRFWKSQSVELPSNTTATVVARFDNGSPAVIEAASGKGRVVVWGGDWEPSTRSGSQWVLSTKFVPWLASLFERAVGGVQRPSVGEIGAMEQLTGGEPARWRALGDSAAFQDTSPSKPGIYEVEQGGVTRFAAIEVPSSESNTEPMSLEVWEKLGVPLHSGVTASTGLKPPPQGREGDPSAQLESRQKLWRWLLIAVTILLAIESVAAYVAARRAAVGPSATAGA